jgi:hypothetical protein
MEGALSRREDKMSECLSLKKSFMKAFFIAKLAAILLVVISCGQKKVNPSIVGKWEYDRLEKAPETKPEVAAKVDADNKGHTIEFFKEGKFVSLRNSSDTLSTGTYELINGGKTLLTHTKDMASGGDSVMVNELTEVQLKFQSSNKDFFIMKRIH